MRLSEKQWQTCLEVARGLADENPEKHERTLFMEADAMEATTVHWLRHTGISDDINKRGSFIPHVRDDAWHSSSAITNRYNDVELKERYESAKENKLSESQK